MGLGSKATLRCVLGAVVMATGVLGAPSPASAEVKSVFGGRIACTTNATTGVRSCPGSTATRVESFDGQPLDVNVALPAAPGAGPDGGYPLLILLHGWGGGKSGMGTLENYARRGYAVLSASARGFAGSCGAQTRTQMECADPKWHIRLDDTRYEIRDVQHLAGILVDEGLVAPERIGATGGSYGGGASMALAALRKRVMLPDGTLVPWTSPKGVPMELAAAAPEIPWTDLAYSLMPNGRTLDYVADAPYDVADAPSGGPVGVLKQSFVAGLYAFGMATGFYAPPGTDPGADLHTWYALTSAGEPYDLAPLARPIIDELTRFHSSYYIDDSIRPAPLLISNGWTDDLFPVDEALRFYNRTKTRHPAAKIGLTFLDYGHQRGQNKGADTAENRARINAFLDHHLLGSDVEAPHDVVAITQTCASPKGEFHRAPTWEGIAKGEVRFRASGDATITHTGGDPRTGGVYDPIVGDGACATVTDAGAAPGTAELALPAATGAGYTLLGSPTVIADISTPAGHAAQVAARLVDVASDGRQTLVARGLYRPEASGRQVFQLHPNGWRVAAGHHLELQLLGHDEPYGRASNVPFTVTFSDLELRLPVAEAPNANPAVHEPLARVVPAGYELARGYR